ncbi:S41 family peptidase [Radiobacillus deserti]|uniref:S41 family peptidase n=1 Tax=Radiobacillus deserti TaxID=2594883 RepID=UPI001E4E48AE|nr:S41 family peptidase [Radiobacillus deserti]
MRRYKDYLYIVSTKQEKGLKPGYVIRALDGIPIQELIQVHKRQLMEESAERENWSTILPLYSNAIVTDEKNTTFSIPLNKYRIEPFEPTYSMESLNENTLLMTLTDFMNHQEISKLITQNEHLLRSTENLIIDVRLNKGGSDLAYFGLLSYLFDEKVVNLSDFDDGALLTNCTKRNVELRTKLLKSNLFSVGDEETKNQVNILIDKLKENEGKGFVELDLSDLENSLIINTKPGPSKVVILVDVFCGSSGESFVEVCKHSSKVTVIGRATLGLNDYANLAKMEWEGRFELWYPTSKLTKVDEGRGMNGVGIQPDIYIPWTPEHIVEDQDLKAALDLLAEDTCLY